MTPPTVNNVLEKGRRHLSAVSETAVLDAQVLLTHVLGKEKSWLLAHPEYGLTSDEQERWEASLATRELGVPLPYVIGEWEFFGLKFMVTPAALIPRPETELLVETGLQWLNSQPSRRRAVDVGTGTGCIPVAMASHIPDLEFVATDVSADALKVAKHNARMYHLEDRIRIVETNLLAGIDGMFDLICSNLPYIPEKRLPSLEVAKWEPRLALGGGEDGLRFIGPFLQQAADHLPIQGLVMAEIDASLETPAMQLAESIWTDASIEVLKDLTDLPRLLVVETR